MAALQIGDPAEERLRSGRPGLFPAPEEAEAEAYEFSPMEREFVSSWMTNIVHGTADEVRTGLGNLEADCWSLPAVQSVLTKMGEAVTKGYFRPGGAGTQFTAAHPSVASNCPDANDPATMVPNTMKSLNDCTRVRSSGRCR